MAQYIDKAALAVKIEKMLQNEYPCDNSEQGTGYSCALYELQDFLDTLEVEGVDLEKEVNECLFSLDIDREERPETAEVIEIVAKHFFELGLKAKGE